MTIANRKKLNDTDPRIDRNSHFEGKLRCKSGISVRSDISFALEKESSSYFPALQLLLACAAVISILFMLQSFFTNNGYKYPLVNVDSACITIFMTALSALMISRGKLFFKLAGGAYLILNVIYIISNSNSAAMGFMYTANIYSKAAELPFRLFETQIANYQPEDMATFLVALSFLCTLLTSVGCIFYVNFPILFLVTFPVFELGAYHGWMPAIWTVVVMVICWVTTLSISLINHTARRSSKSNFAVSLKKKAFYLTSSDIKTKFFSTHALTVIVASTCAFTAALLFYAAKGNYRPESFKELRRNITKKFGEVTTDIANGNLNAPKVPGRSAMVGGLNGGQWLGSLGKIEFTGKTALRVKYKPFSRSLYLRGFTGSSYEQYSDGDSKWEFIRSDIDIINQFKEQNKLILDYNNILVAGNPDFAMPEISTMTVSPVNSDPVAFYAPYGTDYSKCEVLGDNNDQYYDGMLSPKEQRQTYDVEICAPSDMMSWDAVLNEYELLSNWECYPPIYQFYSDYVANEQTYHEVPDYLEPMLKDIINEANIYDTDTLAFKKKKLNLYFASNGFTYSTEFGVTPKDQDFIQYFLEGKNNNKKGCCRHYASAAVMLMRELGYPARYVEGFLIEPSQQTENEWMTISDRSLHAWCEVFIKGFGWYPIELTPGYNSTGNPNLTDKDKNIQKEDSSSSEPDSSSSKSDSSSKGTDSKKDKDNSSSKKAETPGSNSSKSATPVSGKKPGGGGQAGGEDGTGSGGGVKVTYLFMMAVFIVGFAAAIVVRRKHILNEIDKSVNDASDSKSVISCYTALLRYIQLLGIKNDTSLTDVQMSSRITTELSVKAPQLNNIFIEISEPAITAYMSGSEYDKQTADKSRKLLKSAKKMIFGKLGFFERLSAQWISGLY